MTNPKMIGNIGEEIAQNYLLRRGCRILHRNYYSRFGEIDIIAEHDATLLFIEVKYRQNERLHLQLNQLPPLNKRRYV